MSSPLVSAIGLVSTTWAALTPPDRTSETYREDSSKKLGSDVSNHRMFAFGFPDGPDPDSEDGPGKTIAEWTFSAELFVSSAGRNQREAVEAYANETVLLRRAIDKLASYPAGVLDIQITEIRSEERGDDRSAIFTFSALTEETD